MLKFTSRKIRHEIKKTTPIPPNNDMYQTVQTGLKIVSHGNSFCSMVENRHRVFYGMTTGPKNVVTNTYTDFELNGLTYNVFSTTLVLFYNISYGNKCIYI